MVSLYVLIVQVHVLEKLYLSKLRFERQILLTSQLESWTALRVMANTSCSKSMFHGIPHSSRYDSKNTP